MARPAETYRAARKRAARENGVPFQPMTVVKQGLKHVVVPMPPPRYIPYDRRFDRRKLSIDPTSGMLKVNVKERKPPKTYRGPVRSRVERRMARGR